MTNIRALDDADRRSIEAIRDHVSGRNPGRALGLYLYGSTVSGDRGPDSDLDLLLVTRDSLERHERESLTSLLLELSGWSGHVDVFPEAADRRPIELTSFTIGEECPAAPRACHDYQYGEWVRRELLGGAVPQPRENPDMPVLLASAHERHLRLDGAELAALVTGVPEESLRHAAVSLVPSLLDELIGDERNVLLTLARIAVTCDSGGIASKIRAAELTASRLDREGSSMLLAARAEHLGEAHVDWGTRRDGARRTAAALIELIRESGDR